MASMNLQISEDFQKCSICGSMSEFVTNNDCTLRESRCPVCGSSIRTSDITKIILDTFLHGSDSCLRDSILKLTSVSIFEAQAQGSIHDILSHLPMYICSEYFDNIPSGMTNAEGILCEDLQDMSFCDETFDLVITQDVLEHVNCPEKAFSEIHRVLKPGGYHIFTIPFHEDRLTLRRIVFENGEWIDRFPPVFHGDPLREEGALVYTDFGMDMSRIVGDLGFSVEMLPCRLWYSPSTIPYIADEQEYQRYLDYMSQGRTLEYFKYNSWVFRMQKKEQGVA